MHMVTKFLVAVLAGAALPATAEACSVIMAEQPSRAEQLRQARRAIDGATAIVDGEVVRPFIRGRQNALVRSARVLKGSPPELFEVGERDSCDIALDAAGARLRMLLRGGPDVYYLDIDYSNARFEDRLLRSDRRRDWPYRTGGTAPPLLDPPDGGTSPPAQETHGRVALEQIEQGPCRLPSRSLEPAVAVDEEAGVVGGGLGQGLELFRVG
jgi:hypothetical protein